MEAIQKIDRNLLSTESMFELMYDSYTPICSIVHFYMFYMTFKLSKYD